MIVVPGRGVRDRQRRLVRKQPGPAVADADPKAAAGRLQQHHGAGLGAVHATTFIAFEIAAVVLLVAIVAAIVLTMRQRPGLKVQDIAAQSRRAPRGPRAHREDGRGRRRAMIITTAHYLLLVAAALFAISGRRASSSTARTSSCC